MADLITHVEALAREHRVTVRRERRKGGRKGAKAYPSERLVVTYGINGQLDYFVALHEVGHCVLQHHLSAESQTLHIEAEAWEWALKHGIVRPSVLTRQGIAKRLKSYTDGGSFTKPPVKPGTPAGKSSTETTATARSPSMSAR